MNRTESMSSKLFDGGCVCGEEHQKGTFGRGVRSR